MNLLQNLWNLLITENELYTNIITIPLTFLEVLITALIFTSILDIKYSKKQMVIYVITFSIFANIFCFAIPAPYNSIFNLILSPILVFIIFRTSILKAILSEIIPYIFFIILGSITINLYILLLQIPSDLVLTVPIYSIIYSLILYFIIYIVYFIFSHFHLSIHKFPNIKKKNSTILFINFAIGILALYIQSYIATIFADVLSFSACFYSTLILFLYFLFSMFALSRTLKLEQTELDLEEQKLYNKTLNILYDNVRGFKHDFGNIMQAIGGYTASNDMAGLKNYYTQLLEDCQIVNDLNILNPEIINNPAIYSLLTSKYHKAEELGIKIHLDVFLDLGNLNINIYELSRILGILLDNAIEASMLSSEKIINIDIRKDNRLNKDLFIIENSYSNKNVNTDEIFEKGYSSKEDHFKEDSSKNYHGLGLWEVRKIIKKHKNLNLYTTKNNLLFKQQLEIFN